MTFLNNWFAADARGTALTYASVVAVEEKSVIDYNRGNPDGVLSPGEDRRASRATRWSRSTRRRARCTRTARSSCSTPTWVDADEKAAAAAFEAYVQQPENQSTVLAYGFRPNNPTVPLADPIVAANGVDPAQPTAELEVPSPEVLSASSTRGPSCARTPGCCSCSTSRARWARSVTDDGKTRLDLAQEAAISALDQFKDTDDVGLWAFSTDLGGPDPNLARAGADRSDRAEQTRPSPASDRRRSSRRTAHRSTTSRRRRTTTMLDSYDPAKINAIVLLTDGENDDGITDDDDQQFEGLIARCSRAARVRSSQPVRLFTISYGDDADALTLRAISQATRAATYNATNPATINQVFTAVISNF